jgi:hypothetical protein
MWTDQRMTNKGSSLLVFKSPPGFESSAVRNGTKRHLIHSNKEPTDGLVITLTAPVHFRRSHQRVMADMTPPAAMCIRSARELGDAPVDIDGVERARSRRRHAAGRPVGCL